MTTAPSLNGTASHVLTPVQLEAVAALGPGWPGTGNRNKANIALCGGLLRDHVPVPVTEAIVAELAREVKDDYPRTDLVERTQERLQSGEPTRGWPALGKILGDKGAAPLRQFRRLLGLLCTLEDLAAHKKLPVAFLQGLGLHDLPEGGVGIPYRDAGGRTVEIKKRTRLSAGAGSWWPKGKPLMAYGEERLEEAVRNAGHLILVEGESDSWTAWYHRLACLGIPGVESVDKTLQRGHVSCVQMIYVVEETDSAGKDFVANVARRLAQLGWRGRLLSVRPSSGKDLSEMHCLAPDQFKLAWQNAVERARSVEVGGTSAANGKPPRPPEPYRPFPVHALPEPLASFVAQGAAAIGCDPAYLALPALAVVASLIGNTRSIRIKRDWFEPAVVWSGIVGDSGTLKSPALAAVTGPIYKLQKERITQFKVVQEEYEKVKAAYDARAKEAKRKKETLDEDPPEEPTLVRLLTGDVTIEKLAELLEDNPRGILVSRDELGGWLGSFKRYKGKAGGSDLPNWLEFHRAGPLIVDRKTGDRPMLFVEHAAVSVTGGIQPGTLAQSLTPEQIEAGLAARLLLAMPPKLPKRWTEDEIDPDVKAAYEKTIRALCDLEFDRDDGGRKVPFVLRMTPEAKAAWVAFYRARARRQANTEGALAAAYSKLEGYAARLALLHHVVSRMKDGTDSEPIERASIDAGVELVEWFAHETCRIYAMLAETESEKQIRRLIDLLRSWGGSANARRLQRSNEARYRTSEEAEAALQMLVDAGLAEWQEKPTTKTGGHPTRICTLLPHPTPDTTDTTSEDEDELADAPGPHPTPDTTDTMPEEEEDDGLAGARPQPHPTPDTTDTTHEERGDGPKVAPTQPPDTTSADARFPSVSEGSVGSVGCRVEKTAAPKGSHTANGLCQVEGVVSGTNGATDPLKGYPESGVLPNVLESKGDDTIS